MKKIKPIETSSEEYVMWTNVIIKINELVVAVNEMIPFTTGLEEDKDKKQS